MKYRLWMTVLGALMSTALAQPALSGETDKQKSMIALPFDDLYPEGIAVADNGDVFVGTLTRRLIVRVDAETGDALTFTSPDADLMTVLGILVSRDGETVYACSSDPHEEFDYRPAELVAFDRSGAMVGRYPTPSGGFCNDLTELPDGTILFTDTFNPRIYAWSPVTQSVSEWVRDERFVGGDYGLNGITYADGSVYVVRYSAGDLFAISPDGQNIRNIALDRSLQGADGLEWMGENTLLVVENGAGRVSRIVLGADGGEVTSLAEGLNVPTTAALHGDDVYVVESQFDHFFGFDTTAPDPFFIKIIPLTGY